MTRINRWIHGCIKKKVDTNQNYVRIKKEVKDRAWINRDQKAR